MRAFVYGLGIAGEATARALVLRGWDVEIADDDPSPEAAARAAAAGCEYLGSPDRAGLAALLRRFDLLAPSPGVPETHPAITGAQRIGLPVRSEIDLAWEWERDRPGGPRPVLAVTGTDGKTTTTLMAAEMLRAAGLRAVDAGNTDTPLIAAIDTDAEAFVVECTSFRLAWTNCFRPRAAVWLNLAEDHQDWHRSMASYRAAKARIWAFQEPTDAAIGFIDDWVVMAELAGARARHRTFGLRGGDYRLRGDRLLGPQGTITTTAGMRRSLPHDVTNALAAAALVLEAGLADHAAIARALARFEGPPHRLQFVAEHDGVRYYDDSKATTPHAVATALRAFDSLVLIAGGKNKGLDLAPMAGEPGRTRAVVAIGAASDLIATLFHGICPVTRAASMDEAVHFAAALARPGDAVLLSPGCASFDMYTGYPARGADFVRCVTDLIDSRPDRHGPIAEDPR